MNSGAQAGKAMMEATCQSADVHDFFAGGGRKIRTPLPEPADRLQTVCAVLPEGRNGDSGCGVRPAASGRDAGAQKCRAAFLPAELGGCGRPGRLASAPSAPGAHPRIGAALNRQGRGGEPPRPQRAEKVFSPRCSVSELQIIVFRRAWAEKVFLTARVRLFFRLCSVLPALGKLHPAHAAQNQKHACDLRPAEHAVEYIVERQRDSEIAGQHQN